MTHCEIKTETLTQVLTQMLGEAVTHADYKLTPLKGGTVGEVYLVTGTATTATAQSPYKVVLKVQKKWERHGDPNSWRREYDLYMSPLGQSFSADFGWPTCYYAEFSEDETRLWMEYAVGATGEALTLEMLEKAAAGLGRYQGKLYAEKPAYLQDITNLGQTNAVENYYRHWKPKNVEYAYVRAADCEIPKHLRHMLMDIDSRADAIFENIRKLPVVFCHRDFWHANIIAGTGRITLIDWDTAGWGYLGEDVGQLITDETDPAQWKTYRQKLIPAYLHGAWEYMEPDPEQEEIICQIIVIHTGYLYVWHYMQAETPEEKAHYIRALEALYDVFYKPNGGITQ